MTMNPNIKRQPVALVITDCHCGKDTLQDFIQNWQEATGLCVSTGIRHILFAGDLVLSRASQTLDVLLAIHDVFEQCNRQGIRLTLINGNHCKVNQEAARGYCNVFDSFENVRVIDEWGIVTLTDGFEVCMISYFPEKGSFSGHLRNLEEYLAEKGQPCGILIIHEGIRGGLAQPTDTELPAALFSKWDKVLVGHYHNRTRVKPNIEYIGSSRQMNFGEDEEKGYTLIYADGSTEFVKNSINTRYQVIDVAADQVNTHLKDRLDEIRADGRYRTKVRIHGTAARTSAIRKEELLEAGANKVEVIPEETVVSGATSGGLFEKFDSGKIQDSYKDFCHEKEVEDVAFGLTYLSKIEMPCGD